MTETLQNNLNNKWPYKQRDEVEHLMLPYKNEALDKNNWYYTKKATLGDTVSRAVPQHAAPDSEQQACVCTTASLYGLQWLMLTLILWMDTRCVGSEIHQDWDVESLPNPFHHMWRWRGHSSWIRWRKTTLQLRRPAGFSTHLRNQTFNRHCAVYWKHKDYFQLVHW